jgi:hypothetical protein
MKAPRTAAPRQATPPPPHSFEITPDQEMSEAPIASRKGYRSQFTGDRGGGDWNAASCNNYPRIGPMLGPVRERMKNNQTQEVKFSKLCRINCSVDLRSTTAAVRDRRYSPRRQKRMTNYQEQVGELLSFGKRCRVGCSPRNKRCYFRRSKPLSV